MSRKKLPKAITRSTGDLPEATTGARRAPQDTSGRVTACQRVPKATTSPTHLTHPRRHRRRAVALRKRPRATNTQQRRRRLHTAEQRRQRADAPRRVPRTRSLPPHRTRLRRRRPQSGRRRRIPAHRRLHHTTKSPRPQPASPPDTAKAEVGAPDFFTAPGRRTAPAHGIDSCGAAAAGAQSARRRGESRRPV